MPGTNLTRDEAEERAGLVSVETYDVALDLTTSETTFRTRSTITFSATAAGSETFVDFIGDSVQSIDLNGESLDPADHYDGARVRVPGLAEQNVLTIDATANYMNTGEGLHRFVDPVDNEVYLYSQFEVPHSRRMYPVFEQPDLKATFTFTVTGPAHWQVLSNTATPQPAPTGFDGAPAADGVATWRFAPTPTMASYITALVAGPFAVVRDTVATRSGDVDLGVFCRKSLVEYLDADNILEVTKQGFAFFEAEFDHPYAFGKYDQVFTPEYNWGAMENAGLVTFNEKYVFRAKVTESLIERRALTILHELAHMWFGNLVTMKWWNDLWLNESFAEWASTTCQAEATAWTSAWQTFCAHEKSWAYRQDQLSTTHPIVAPIRDLADVEVNFDGITYAKGASVLKQLVAYVGREPFVAGLRTYFATHAWGNTTLDDLLKELEATSGRDLRAWSALWLETAGVNTLRPVIEADSRGFVSQAHIEQTATAQHPTLRPHRLAVGAYDLHGARLVRRARFEMDVDGATTALPQLVGQRQPDLLLVNDDDLTYAKIRFDERSLATALAHPQALAESLPATLTLAALWDQTRDGEIAACDYIRLALDTLPGKTDSTMVKTLLEQISTATLRFTSPAHRRKMRRHVVHTLRDLAISAPPASDAQLQLVSAHAALLAPGDDTAWAAGLLSGEVTLPGLALDTDMRWRLLAGLTAAGAAAPGALEAELVRDDTAGGREWAALVRASEPKRAAKQAAWDAVWGEGGTDLSTSIIQNTGIGFSRSGDPELMGEFVDQYLAAVGSIEQRRTSAIAETLITVFFPGHLADADLLTRLDGWLDEHADAPSATRRLVAENRDNVARAVTAQLRDVPDPW